MKHNKFNKLLRRVLMVGAVAVALALMFAGQNITYGQGNGILPWVVNTIPARGDELSVDHGVTFTFNTAMNRASVEAAFGVTPAVAGSFQWKSDTILTYLPTKPFDRATAYIFTLDSRAKSSIGTALRDTFSLKLHTTGYLEVTQIFPEDDSNGTDLRPPITIVFNRPVVPLGTAEQMQALPAPFQSYPEMEGKGQWQTTSIYTFQPTTPLMSNTVYVLNIPKGLTDVSGSSLKEGFYSRFKTIKIIPPQLETFMVHYIAPEDGRGRVFRSPLIRVGFNYPVDVPSAESGFSLIGPKGQVIPGSFKWDKENVELGFRPSVLLDYSTNYTIKVDRTKIRSVKGTQLSASAVSSFSTLKLPSIVDTSPHDGELVNSSVDVNLTFSAPMKLDDLAKRIEILPKVAGVVLDTDIGPDSTSARIQFGTLPSTTYTVTINTDGMTDIWGTQLQLDPNPIVYKIVGKNKIQFRYVTGALGPAASLETAGQSMGLYNAYHQTRVFVTHRNIGTIGMSLSNVPLPLFLNLSTNTPKSKDEQEHVMRRWVVPIYNPQNIMRYDLLSITTDGASIGQQGNLVCVEAAPSILAVGQRVSVVRKEIPKDDKTTPTVPASINVRNQPGLQTSVAIGRAASGTEFDVVDGPVCADQYVWWKVQNADGTLNGWIAEGDLKQPYVAPLTSPAATLPATASPTMSATAAATDQAAMQTPITPGGLKPGIYRLEMEAPEITNNEQHVSHLMLVATDNITLKVGQHEALAWITDLKSGQPSPGLSVQFYRMIQQANYQKMLPFGSPVITDQDGIARFSSRAELNPGSEIIYAAVNGDGHFGIAASVWTLGIDAPDFQQPTMFNSEDMALYLYTDRRLYRRGDKIYFKGTIRNRDDAVYSMSNKTAIPVDIIDPYNQTIYSKKLPLNEYGSFSDSFSLDTNGILGEYRIVARPNKPDPKPKATPMIGTATPLPPGSTPQDDRPDSPQFTTEITVADYTPPEFRVAVNAESPHVTPGDKVRATVESTYYFGGPVSNAKVEWTVRTDPYYFYYTGGGAYSFEDYNQDQISQDYEDDQSQFASSGSGRTDDTGHYTIQFPAALGKSRRSLIYTIEATVSDQSNQLVAERSQVVVDPGQYHVGVGVENYVGAANENQRLHVIAVNNNSVPLTNTPIDVRVVRRVWASVQTVEPGTGRTIWQNDVAEQDVSGGQVQTDSNGKGTFDFTPLHGGAYKVYASSKDSKGNVIKSSTFLWIAGKDFVSWREPNSNRIDLQADKSDYKVGETASILIPTPFQGTSTALITVERSGILKKEVVTLHSNSMIYKLPITPDMAPDAFISVTVIKGEDEHNFTAAFRTGLIQLNVDTGQLGLQIAVESDKKKAGPREQVTYKLHVTNYAGEPVQAEVGLALVDEAIISLMPDNLPSLMSYFYSRQGLGVRTANTLIYNIDQETQEIINIRKGGGKGGSDYFGIFTVRQNFVGTPLWAPSVITDSSGNASITVTLPDQLTTWVLDARAYTLPMGPTKTTLVGQTTHSLVSTKPLLVRPEVPRFYVVGDTSTLSAIVNNNTDEPQQVAVTVDITGAAIKGDLVHYATIPANDRLNFEWPMTVLDAASVDVTFKVASKDGHYTDAAKPSTGQGDDRLLPILRYETPDTVTTGGVIGNEGGIRTEGLLVPSQVTGAKDNTLQIHVDRSLASSSTAALHTLKIFPYYCIEQTVSRFLPDAVMYRAQRALGLNDKALYDDLSAVMETAFQRIYNDQHSDGGWGWFIDDQSDQLISAYTMLGLAEAKSAGWQVDSKVFAKGLEGLRQSLKEVNDNTPSWDLNRQAFILYVLARASELGVTGNFNVQVFDVSRSVKLFDQRDRMNLDATAFLAMDFAIIEPGSGYHRNPLMDNIKRAAQFSLTGEHWEESSYDTWNWTTNTRTTAIVLEALVKTEPTSPLIPDTVRWLMTARKFDSWETTQETVWSVMGLTDWMLQTGDLKPDYGFGISLNGQYLTSGEIASADNARIGYDLKVSVGQLLANQINQIAIQRNAGSGTLYYTAQLKTYLPVENVKAISRGIMIERTYSLENDKKHTPITTAHVGDQIRVTLNIVVPESLNYVAIEDPIPAGTQSIDVSLQTTPRQDAKDPLRYGWLYWVFTHTELRDDRTILYAPYLPKGTYQYVYQLRAGVAGTYHVLPANGHEFYMPEVFGRSDGQIFKLLPAGIEEF
ncbi:MAG: Ig-like domain-containing protein [Chloroflexota bacterium]